MFNKIILVGNLTRDIELRYTQGGSAIGSSAIAVTRKYTNAQGQKTEETCFIDITFFGKQAETAKQYLNKGSKLLIEGRLRFEQWQDNNAQSHTKHSVAVESMQMLGSPQNQQGGANNYQGQQQQYAPQGYDPRQAPRNAQATQYNERYEQDDNSIPF